MSPEDVARLDAEVAQAPRAELPAWVGALARLHAVALARLTGGGQPMIPPPEEPDRLLTPEQAAALARVKPSRIYAWARGQRWASRPSRRCLRIHEAGFRRWLASRT